MLVQSFERAHLPLLLDLVNMHLAAVVPGWAISEAFLAEHLDRNPGEYVTDPWVVERVTLCALEGHRMLAAAHLLRYGDGLEVGEHLRGVGEIAWFVFLPDRGDAADKVLSRVRGALAAWSVERRQAYGAGLPKMPLLGIPEAWPHVASALEAAGYEPIHGEHRGVLYGGRLAGLSTPARPPIPGMTIRRTTGRFGVRFSAVLDEEDLGWCEWATDLARGGSLPALRGWAELVEMYVVEDRRNKTVGSWLIGRVADWLRLCGCDRVILTVDEDDEAAGAGRFYRRFGWNTLTREIHPWRRENG